MPERSALALGVAAGAAREAWEPLAAPAAVGEEERERIREVVAAALAGAGGGDGCEVVLEGVGDGVVTVRVTGPAWLLEPPLDGGARGHHGSRMHAKDAVDHAVAELAAGWLEDHPELDTPEARVDLARTIQRAVEAWLEERGARVEGER